MTTTDFNENFHIVSSLIEYDLRPMAKDLSPDRQKDLNFAILNTSTHLAQAYEWRAYAMSHKKMNQMDQSSYMMALSGLSQAIDKLRLNVSTLPQTAQTAGIIKTLEDVKFTE